MNGSQLNKVLNFNMAHALYREDGTWYHQLKKFPGVLFDKQGYIVFYSEEDYISNQLLQRKKDLHIKDGISSLIGYQKFTEEEISKIILAFSNEINYSACRISRQISVIVRNIVLVKELKRKYNNACQICGTKLEISKDIFYSEVHHIRPLGRPHYGPDTIENMLCVCPNHHILLDMRAIKFNISDLLNVNHRINKTFVEYHNNLVDRF